MQKIGIKFEKLLDYERFEPLQYWLDYEFEYEDLEAYIEEKKVIKLEFEEDEDRAEDIEMLQAYLNKFDKDEIVYELFVMNDEWEKEELKNII
jgi:superfamily I DNA/RNA helicase